MNAFLKKLYEPKMDVKLTIRFKITAEIEITKHMFCVLLCRRGRVSAFCSFIHLLQWNMRLHCFFTVNSSVNAAGDHLVGGSFMEKE